ARGDHDAARRAERPPDPRGCRPQLCHASRQHQARDHLGYHRGRGRGRIFRHRVGPAVIHFLQYVVDALTTSSLYVLLALPVALVYGIMDLVNFAQGELLTIGAYTLFLLGAIWLPLAVFLGLVAVVAAALAMERAAFRPVRGASPETLLVTSFAVSYFLQNLALTLFGSRPKSVSTPAVLNSGVHIGALRVQWLSVVTVAACIICVGALTMFLTRTRFGIQMRAAAEDFTMARLLGVKADAVVSVAFVMSGVLAGVACFVLVVQ